MHAMTGTWGSIDMTCLTNRHFHPHVAVALLLVKYVPESVCSGAELITCSISRAIYHEARSYLYMRNSKCPSTPPRYAKRRNSVAVQRVTEWGLTDADLDIVFDHFASELNIVNAPFGGLVRCRKAGCVDGVPRLPAFRFITFDLGHSFCIVSLKPELPPRNCIRHTAQR